MYIIYTVHTYIVHISFTVYSTLLYVIYTVHTYIVHISFAVYSILIYECQSCTFSVTVKCAPTHTRDFPYPPPPPPPQVVYEVPSTSQWCFDVQWCPRNPGLISTSSFDGHISVYSLLGGAGGEGESKEVSGEGRQEEGR